MDTALAKRPECKSHGPMVLRTDPTTEAAWCGTWYDCRKGVTLCGSSTLLPSPALIAQNRQVS